jgi:adenosylhomocysteine nucleosidase
MPSLKRAGNSVSTTDNADASGRGSQSDTPQILVVAALRYELASLRADANPELALLETGEGIANAERQLEGWLAQNSARAVLSIGFAGALSSSLKVADLVIADRIRGTSEKPCEKLLMAAKEVRVEPPARLGVAFTSHEILCQSQSKRALASSLNDNEIGFVDMESTAIASVCSRRGIPFLIIRSISDLLGEDLPLDFNQYRSPDGRVHSSRVMKAALLRPRSLKGLFLLRKRSKLCAHRMAEFVHRLVPLIR